MRRIILLVLLSSAVLAACNKRPSCYRQGCSGCDLSDSTGNGYPGTVNLQSITWKSLACFNDAVFGDTTRFSYSFFSDTAAFTDASFAKGVDFSHAIFKKPAYFDDVNFCLNSYFDYTQFGRYAKFTNLQTTNGTLLQFNGAILPDTLDFSQNPNLLCTIDLTTADFTQPGDSGNTPGEYGQPHQLFLYNTNISKFKLDYFHFRLLLPDSSITPSFGSNREKITLDKKEMIYEALLANFKAAGQDESYQRLDIEYQQFKWQNSWAPWFGWIPRVWWNFGYDKQYVFFWIIGALLCFTFLNYWWLPTLNNRIYGVLDEKDLSTRRQFRRRIWQSGFYTANIFFRVTLERSCMKFECFWATLYFFVVYILGILCLGYLANFVLQH